MALQVAYQIYSAREEAERDLRSVLQTLKRIGYDGVEFAGFYGHDAQGVAAMLRETGLTAVSSHVPMQSILEDPQAVIAFHQAIGCPHIAVPYLPEELAPGGKGFAGILRVIAAFGRQCKEAGIQLLYHNHDFEFVELSGQFGLDFLYDAIEPAYLATELDICWVKVAGQSPEAYIRKYAGRCPVVHLKDFVGGKSQGDALYALIQQDGSDDRQAGQTQTFDFRPVGHGVQDIPAAIRAGLESGTQWFVVEQDRSTERPPLEAARMSCDYLRGLPF